VIDFEVKHLNTKEIFMTDYLLFLETEKFQTFIEFFIEQFTLHLSKMSELITNLELCFFQDLMPIFKTLLTIL
jgi:hypothetical protein